MNMYINICMNIYTDIFMYVSVYMCIYICIYVYAYIYIHLQTKQVLFVASPQDGYAPFYSARVEVHAKSLRDPKHGTCSIKRTQIDTHT